MTSERQIEANRNNARRSTGPKTKEGKARSSRNAVTHGILASVIPADTPGWQELLLGLYEALRPENEMQRTLVDQIAVLTIRIRRWLANGQKQFEWECTYQNTDTPNYQVDDALLIGMRYEAQLNRHLHRNLQALERLKGPNPHSHTSVADQVCPYLYKEKPAGKAAPSPSANPAEMASFGKNSDVAAAPDSQDAAPILPYSHEIPPTALTYASATPEEQYRVRMASFRNSDAGNPGAAAALGARPHDPQRSKPPLRAPQCLEATFDDEDLVPDWVIEQDRQERCRLHIEDQLEESARANAPIGKRIPPKSSVRIDRRPGRK